MVTKCPYVLFKRRFYYELRLTSGKSSPAVQVITGALRSVSV